MSDSAILRLVRAARRAVPSFHIASNAVSAGFLAWLTTKAAAEAATKEVADNSEKSHGTVHEATHAASYAGTSGTNSEFGATASEDGAGGRRADATTGRAESDNAHSESAPNGVANGKGQDGGATGVAGATSVGSSTNPAILFTGQAMDTASTVLLATALLPDAKPASNATGNAVNDVGVVVPGKQGAVASDPEVITDTGNETNNAPAITSNGGGAAASISVAENTIAVTTVTATDADPGATLSYSIVGGADAAQFMIDATTGVLSFVSAPDFEAPADAGADNVYDVKVQVSDGVNVDTQDIAITVSDVSDTPLVITSDGGGSTAAISVAESSTAVTTVTAVDIDSGATLTYSISGGADAAKFTINATTGVLAFVSAPDAEAPADAGANNVYDVQVQVSDGTNVDTQDIAVTVTDINDNAPAITSNGGGATASVNVAENTTAVTTVTATDADAGATLAYSIVGGADAAKFTINATTGVLSFVSAPDAEAPTDAGSNNVYDVQVQVSDGTNTDTQDIAVTVTNVNDNTPVDRVERRRSHGGGQRRGERHRGDDSHRHRRRRRRRR